MRKIHFIALVLCAEILVADQPKESSTRVLRTIKEVFTHGHILESHGQRSGATIYFQLAQKIVRPGDDYYKRIKAKCEALKCRAVGSIAPGTLEQVVTIKKNPFSLLQKEEIKIKKNDDLTRVAAIEENLIQGMLLREAGLPNEAGKHFEIARTLSKKEDALFDFVHRQKPDWDESFLK